MKAGATNVRDNAILPPTASGDGAGARFVSTDCVRRWRWGALLGVTAAFASTFRSITLKTLTNFQFFLPPFFLEPSVQALGSHGGVGWELRRLSGSLYSILILSSVWSDESWSDLERLREKW